jgi:hypothetical protein
MDSFILKAKFSEEQAGALFAALKDLQRVQCDRFAINFTTDKQIKISTQTESKAIAVIMAFDSNFFTEAEIKQDLNFAIMNVSEMVSILNVFSGGFEMVADNTTLKLSTEETELVYYAGNLKLVRTGPKALEKELPYLQKVEFNSDKYKSFVKALPVLDHGYVIFKGVNGQSELQISITDKDIRSNSFTQKVKCEALKDTFKVVVNKQSLIAILGSNNFASLNLGICKDMIHIDGINSAYKASFFLRTVV